jgi:Protein of unknown function (DUF1573)
LSRRGFVTRIGAVKRLRLLLASVLGISCLASPAFAAGHLRWECQNIEVTAEPGQKVVHVDFPFRNSGDRPVTIISVETSCRCTSADTAKKVYGPGEKDAVGVDFAVGAQTGTVVQSVTVSTDGPELEPFYLTLRVTIPGPRSAK